MWTPGKIVIGAAAAVTVVPLMAAPARAAEPADATVVPIQVTGDPATRFNLVVLGDGYTPADMPKFRTDLAKHLNDLWTLEPFNRGFQPSGPGGIASGMSRRASAAWPVGC